MNDLGTRIRELRIERGLTQPQLAKMVGVTNAVISFWENNVNEPKASYVKKLAKSLNVTTDYLLGN
ncbi:MAG: helix-turn-helix domain-containing protein [Clostridia bacterium]|nr:helix-turn-helix domain-containing protein [Clostridia bacterium]